LKAIKQKVPEIIHQKVIDTSKKKAIKRTHTKVLFAMQEEIFNKILVM
jgi:hypothetical protein